jgi:hypothetical protein
VVTSPAELHEVQPHAPLREYLCENAARLLNFLVEHHGLPHGSSIYVVTGTVLSATWATATHATAMDPVFNTLTLKRFPGSEDNESSYRWTHRGNAQTRTQGSRVGRSKDQCIFLRGFMITASPAVWQARKELALRATSPPSESSPGSRPNQSQNVPSSTSTEGEFDAKGKGIAQAGQFDSIGSLLAAPSALSQATVHSVPPEATYADDYPSLEINKALLEAVCWLPSYQLCQLMRILGAV